MGETRGGIVRGGVAASRLASVEAEMGETRGGIVRGGVAASRLASVEAEMGETRGGIVHGGPARSLRVLVAMSGGVDSSVAAAQLLEAGYDIAGVTMKLWGGPSDTGCCSVSDVDDARWVADELGIEHHVFNFGDDFERHVVAPYVADHSAGLTPNPCVECNRHIKFHRLLRRADALGFDLVATGHHARIVESAGGPRIARGVDAAKDQSYVLHMLDGAALERLLLPVGEMTKTEVRCQAEARGLVTASKPDSQDVCFITASAGRRQFLGQRIPMRSGRLVDTGGREVGTVEAMELVTVGQRRGLGAVGGGAPRYVLDVDAGSATVTVGDRAELDCELTPLADWRWTGAPVDTPVHVQTSAHGSASEASIDAAGCRVLWSEPRKAVAPGQSVVAYAGDIVVGGGTAARPVRQRVT